MQKDDVIYRQDAIKAIHKEARLAGGSVAIQYADMFQCALLDLPSAQLDFDITVKIDKAYDDGYDAGYLQGKHDWGDLDE